MCSFTMDRDDFEATAAISLLLLADGWGITATRSDLLEESDTRLRVATNMPVKARKTGSRQRLSETSQAIVVAWLEDHFHNPYPSKVVKRRPC